MKFAITIISAIGVFFLLEHLYPAKKYDYRAFRVSMAVTLISGLILSPLLAEFPTQWMHAIAAKAHSVFMPMPINFQVFGYWFDNPPTPIGYAPSVFAIVVFTLLGQLFVDFFYYWFHRLQHTRLLWWQHRIHHSDENFCVATAYRIHWLETTLRACLMILPMNILFHFTPMQNTIMGAVVLFHGVFIHSNIQLNLGPLTPVILGPQAHRIHHSIEERHRDKNFCAWFPVWDIIFGTYCAPGKNEYPDTGITETSSIAGDVIAPIHFILKRRLRHNLGYGDAGPHHAAKKTRAT